MRAYPVFMVQKASNRLSAFLVCVCVFWRGGVGVFGMAGVGMMFVCPIPSGTD